jgi:hypothetical protein
MVNKRWRFFPGLATIAIATVIQRMRETLDIDTIFRSTTAEVRGRTDWKSVGNRFAAGSITPTNQSRL